MRLSVFLLIGILAYAVSAQTLSETGLTGNTFAQEDIPADAGSFTPESVSARFDREVAALEERFRADVQKLVNAYLSALLKAEHAAQQRSDLDLILAVRAEIQRVESSEQPVAAVESDQEPLAVLQRTWNESLAKQRREKQREHRALSLRVAAFAEQQIKPAVQANDVVTAVAWRDLAAGITEQTPEPVPEEKPKPAPRLPGGLMPLHTLTLWNQHNAHHNDRGTTAVSIQAFWKGNVVWKKEGVPMEWKKGTDQSLTLTFRSPSVDEVLVSVDAFHDQGGGLAEIILDVNGQRKKPAEVEASASWSETYSPRQVIDGITTSSGKGKGYWLLPNGKTGWIRVTY